jgi:hypothetical protein
MATNWTTVTDWKGILQSANTNTEGYFWLMILWAVWIVVLMLTSVFGLYPALMLASFIGMIFGLFLVYAELVAWPWVLTYLATIIIAILMISWTSNKR